MKYLKYPFIFLWRIWFYFLILITILVLFPILLIVLAKVEYYPYFYKIAHYWGKFIVFAMGFRVKLLRSTTLVPNKSYMVSPNHTALIDGMVLLSLIPNNPLVFVGKIELKKIPIFGYIYKKSCIMVDRSDKQSRANVYKQVEKKLDYGYSISIFPEGGVPDESVVLDRFKDGAFSMAIEHKIPLVPISFLNFKEHMSWTFFSGGPGTLYVKMHDPIDTQDMTMADMESFKTQVRQIILEDLENYKSPTKKKYA